MRKLTALTVAFTFSAAGYAFAGPPHAPAVHAPAAHAPAAHAPAVRAEVIHGLTNNAETERRIERQMDRQAVKGTTAKSDAKAEAVIMLESDAKELRKEVGRLIDDTRFNGKLLLLGDAKSADEVKADAPATEVGTERPYIAGLAFAVGDVMKFKQHKDNPTQTTIGTPEGLLFVGAALLFLPSILSVEEHAVSGTSAVTDLPGVMIAAQ